MTLGIYQGVEKLCFGFDIGTTMSAVCFAHLENGSEPRVRLVTRWPGQEEAQGDSKVPTVVRYNSQGRAVQFGSVAVENEEDLQGTTLVKWFKLHLHPAAMRTANNLTPPPLPSRVGIKRVYTDFLKYTFAHTKSFVSTSSLVNWDRLKDSFVIVMAIPNGWDDTQQALLRSAVVAADILPEKHDRDRLQFVSEAEASIHYAIKYGGMDSELRKGSTVAVCDAGGSTVDTTVYTCTSAAPNLQLKEITFSECVQAGGVCVDEAARLFLERKLAGSSKYGSPDIIKCMVREFEKKTKRKFDDAQEKSFIQFGQSYDSDRPRGIVSGRVTLTRDEVRSLFQFPVAAIGASIDNIMTRSRGFDSLLFVGGFAESAYLRAALGGRPRLSNVRQINIGEPNTKAAAEGAVAWYAKQFVEARAARATYGIEVITPYDSSSVEHRKRESSAFVDARGVKMSSNAFSSLIRKNEVVQSDKSLKHSYYQVHKSRPSSLSHYSLELVCIDSAQPGEWTKHADGTADERFRSICTITADLSGLEALLRPMTNPEGLMYWRIDFEIEIFFGQTSLCANFVWTERGQTRKGPVTTIYNSMV